MAKAHLRDLRRFVQNLYLNMDFKNHREFERKYLLLSLQRGKTFTLFIFLMSFFHLYLDYMLYRDPTVDPAYRQTLFAVHIVVFLLAVAYLAFYRLLVKKNLQNSRMAKALVLSEICVILFFASVLSLNSQRFNGNIDAYIMIVLVGALIIPIYPKWVLSAYAANHILFLIGLSHFSTDNALIIKQSNATMTILVAMVLFLLLYRSNVTNFLHEEMLEEDRRTFGKLFEMNPFPLLISRLEDGRIQYANEKAVSFYELPEPIPGGLSCVELFKEPGDFENIRKRLEADGKLIDSTAEQRTLSGRTKYTVVNYERIDYFGEQSILSGVADIGEIKRIEKELALYASADPLTGVLNRSAGMNLLQMRFEGAGRGQAGFCLCFFDVDNLKAVNDTFGHLEGDAMLADICKVIARELRQDDIIFRYGGDEFMILFENSREQDVRKICDRIERRFAVLNRSRQKPYHIGASFGVFAYAQGAEMELSLEQIIEMADKDMYHNKAEKRLLRHK